ncbi:MAG: hypothetical protein LBB47_02205 [Spirochaetaceae bacterium]|jgi:hypothetical protein|nr:hypothetical protein [Spirochaetaceae bacterium]
MTDWDRFMQKYSFAFKNYFCLFCMALLPVYFAACSRSAPTIAFSTISLNYIEEDSGPFPSLSFFVLAGDDDGYEDLAELRLYNDYGGLLWSFTPETWIRHDEAGNTWIGSRRIAMAGGEVFPSGQYRAVLIDKGGDRTERTFGFDVPSIPRHPFPKFTVTDGRYDIASEYAEHYFLCYDQEGAYRSSVKLETNRGELSSLRLGADILSVAVWAHDTEYSTSALTKMTAIR